MDKKVSVKNIDKIMKHNKFENKTITYKCGDEDINISVIPFAGMEHRLVSIATGVSLIDDSIENRYVLGVKSIGLDLAILLNFADISDKISNAKLIDFIETTDVIEKIKEALPSSVYANFVKDFNDVANMITTCYINEKKDAFYSRMHTALDNTKEFLDALKDMPIDELDSLGEDFEASEE